MAKNPSNRETKEIIRKAIDAQKALIQASFDACRAKRDENQNARQKLAEEQKKLRLQRLANLRKNMVIIFAEINGEIVILTNIDLELLKLKYSVGMNHYITYGSSDYEKLNMMASYTYKGKRLDKSDSCAYTVSTADGFNFDIIGTDGTTILSFETLIHYESLVGTSVSGVQFDQFFYDPFQCPFDAETAKFHAELDRLIKADADYVSENPELLEEGHIPYFRLEF